jgi:hypothetical protein
VPIAGRLQQREERASQQGWSDQVHAQLALNLAGVDRLEWLDQDDARIVDQHVTATEVLSNRVGDLLCRTGIAQVDGQREHRSRQASRQRPDCFGAEVDGRDPKAERVEPVADLAANPARCASDHRDGCCGAVGGALHDATCTARIASKKPGLSLGQFIRTRSFSM